MFYNHEAKIEKTILVYQRCQLSKIKLSEQKIDPISFNPPASEINEEFYESINSSEYFDSPLFRQRIKLSDGLWQLN